MGDRSISYPTGRVHNREGCAVRRAICGNDHLTQNRVHVLGEVVRDKGRDNRRLSDAS